MKIGVDYIGVSAGAVISNKDGKIFLAKRGQSARDDIGLWEFPGGAIEFYETREHAVHRNIKEKYDFDIEIIKVLGIYDVIDKINKDHWLSTTFVCKYVGGDPKIVQPDKCSDFNWFTPDELNILQLSRISKLNLEDLKNNPI
jgi:8-oxo-dGTP diphosphatase